ncbi:terminal protein Tpg-like protein [Kitasatospora fiedleri]|uniref:terminal protein Tpg-like protein n=1 Tax=Kitasatospora fiedleri TaxID=2991545 RepID=UPI00249CC399|nr:terminal protein Tpg-like protein [Kitasatospora fiedleri]
MISQKLPGDVARRLYAARDAGASQAQQEEILADALSEHYFRNRDSRARGLDAEVNSVEWMDIEV